MKASILLLLILGVAAAAVTERVLHRSRRDLEADMQDFVRVLPTRVLVIVKQYIDNDEEVQAIVKYFEADNLHELISKLMEIPEVVQLISYLMNAGVDVQAFLGTVNRLSEAANSIKSYRMQNSTSETGGISGFIQEIKNALPLRTLRNLYNRKLRTSEDFRKLIAAITSEEFARHITAIEESEGYQQLVEEIGVDLLELFTMQKPMVGSQE